MPHNTIFLIFYEFFKIGLFTFGGGYGSLPFLYELVNKYNWFSQNDLVQMIAISGITPGPIGLNMATFCGFSTYGIKGALISSLALILPMLIITTQIFRLYRTFSKNDYVQKCLYFLRPTACALITSVGVKLFYDLVMNKTIIHINYEAFFIVALLFVLTFKLPRNPIIYMSIAGVIGVLFYFIN